jgi:hypothetical protein
MEAPNMETLDTKDKPDGFIHTHGKVLHDQGYRIVDILPHRKHPAKEGWQHYRFTDQDVVDYIKGQARLAGVGILCGETVAVDLDIKDPALAQEMEKYVVEQLGHAPCRYGYPPKRLLVYRTDEPFEKLTSQAFLSPDNADHKVEILAKGQQFVAYHIHPDTGQPYYWDPGFPELANIPQAELETITVAQARLIIAHFDLATLFWTPTSLSGHTLLKVPG